MSKEAVDGWLRTIMLVILGVLILAIVAAMAAQMWVSVLQGWGL